MNLEIRPSTRAFKVAKWFLLVGPGLGMKLLHHKYIWASKLPEKQTIRAFNSHSYLPLKDSAGLLCDCFSKGNDALESIHCVQF